MTTLDAAQEYVSRGWQPIPVPHRSKKPVLNGWPDLRLSAADLARHFDGQPSNLGVLLGVPSGWLVDADLDCDEALRLGPALLPPTGSHFGRASKRSSHRLYVVTTAVHTEKFVDPDSDTTLVELRSTGAQTIFPGSVHEGGKAITWDEDGKPAAIDGATLRRAVAELAVACLLARHWPAKGHRHDAALAAAGLLVRGGLNEVRAAQIVYHAALAAGDDEAADRKQDVVTTVAKLAAGEPVTGRPTLAETLRGDGVKVVATVRRWLGLRVTASAEPLTDVTNAARFVAQHGHSFRYCYEWGAWLHFDGRRW